jgi:hypothetical protein
MKTRTKTAADIEVGDVIVTGWCCEPVRYVKWSGQHRTEVHTPDGTYTYLNDDLVVVAE